jgi:hypothetical protein
MKTYKHVEYPESDGYRDGCKVCWRYYTDKAKADECAKAARLNAEIDAARGYDFGYNAPGTIDWIEQRQMWEVCCP